MAKHKPICWVMMTLLVVGAVNWGLIGLGGFIDNPNLNVVNMIFGSMPKLEWLIYLLVGVSGIMMGYFTLTMKDCGCQKMDKE